MEADFFVGGRCEFIPSSAKKLDAVTAKLKSGQIVRILELNDQQQMRIQLAGEDCWTPVYNKDGTARFAPVLGAVGSVGLRGEVPQSLLVASLEAARAGNVHKLTSVLAQAEVAETTRQAALQSWKAEDAGSTECLVRAACLNAPDTGGRTPLMYAAAWGRLMAVQFLVGFGEVDVNAVDTSGLSALHYACKQAQGSNVDPGDLCTALIEGAANPLILDKNGFCPLSFAAARGHFGAAKALLNARACAMTNDNQGKLPLCYANYFGHRDVADMLFAANSPPNSCSSTVSEAFVGLDDNQSSGTGKIKKGKAKKSTYKDKRERKSMETKDSSKVRVGLSQEPTLVGPLKTSKGAKKGVAKCKNPKAEFDSSELHHAMLLGRKMGFADSELEFLDVDAPCAQEDENAHAPPVDQQMKNKVSKQTARAMLRKAQDSGNENDLRSAIVAARVAGIGAGVWRTLEDLLDQRVEDRRPPTTAPPAA